MSRFFDRLLARRRLWVWGLGGLTLLAVSRLPDLRAVFEPEALVEVVGPGRGRGILTGFADGGDPLMVVLEADDVLSDEPLAYGHRLARAMAAQPCAARVESITLTPVLQAEGLQSPAADPVRGEPPGPGLDELERAGTDTPGDPPSADGPAEEEALADELGQVLATDPDRFPLGLLSLSGPTGALPELRPLVPGPRLLPVDAARVRDALGRLPSLGASQISEDRRYALLTMWPRGDPRRCALALRTTLDAHPPPPSLTAAPAGLPEVKLEMVAALSRDQVRLVGLAAFLSVVVLWLVFRSWAGVLLPMAAAGISSGLLVGAMAWFGEPLNLVNNVVPALLITLGLGDSIHLLVRYREELAEEGAEAASVPGRLRAASRTMHAMAQACFLTSATTAIGFASLCLSPTPVIRRFAVVTALGVLAAYVVTVLWLPSVLPSFRVRTDRRERLARWVVRCAAGALRHRYPVLAFWACTLLASLWLAPHIAFGAGLTEQLAAGSRALNTSRIVDAHLGGFRTLYVGLEARDQPGLEARDQPRLEARDQPGLEARDQPGLEARDQAVLEARDGLHHPAALRALAELERDLRAEAVVRSVVGPATLVGRAWESLTQVPNTGASAFDDGTRAEALFSLVRRAMPARFSAHVHADGRRARVVVRLADAGEHELEAFFRQLEARDIGPFEMELGGEAYRTSGGLARLLGDLLSSLGLAVFVIFGVMGLLLQSARLACISVLPNLLPLTVSVAYMALRGIPLQAATAIVFTISIGIAVDGTIHILARFKEEASAGRERTAVLGAVNTTVLRAMRQSGAAVVVGTATMIAGFLALGQASFMPIRWFAELSLVAMVTSVAAELTLLPVLLAAFGTRRHAATADPS